MIQPNPLISLYAIDVPTDPPTKMRATAYPKMDDSGVALHFERDSAGAPIPYYSFEIWHEETSVDSEGGGQKVNITVQNITRESIALAEDFSGLAGQKVRHVIVRHDELPDATPRFEEELEILESNFTEVGGTLVCGRTALIAAKFPARRISRIYCQHAYARGGCGYDATRVGALQTCDFTLDGPNGCYVHGDDEAAAGRPNLHDRNGRVRALLFPGVARAIE